jgi:hypothetical protein
MSPGLPMENSSMFYWIRVSAYLIGPAFSEASGSLKLQHLENARAFLGTYECLHPLGKCKGIRWYLQVPASAQKNTSTLVSTYEYLHPLGKIRVPRLVPMSPCIRSASVGTYECLHPLGKIRAPRLVPTSACIHLEKYEPLGW